MKSVLLFLAIATAVPTSAATAASLNRQAGFGTTVSGPVERKAGCTGCACCDFITVAGIRIPVAGTGPVKPRAGID